VSLLRSFGGFGNYFTTNGNGTNVPFELTHFNRTGWL